MVEEIPLTLVGTSLLSYTYKLGFIFHEGMNMLIFEKGMPPNPKLASKLSCVLINYLSF